MKKVVRNIIIGATGLSMLFAFTGCNPDDDITPIHSDTETRPVALAIGALDENFNPFLYTSANDGEVIAMTQISMLTSNASGEIVCGDNEATMVRDYSVTSYADANESKVATGSDTIDHTTYKFVIKNGVKDSEGIDMGIRDVLFNLYVYLDPLYGGSSTIYSTKIQGLKAYQAQNPELDNNSSFDYQAKYKAEAQTRYADLLDYANGEDGAKSFTELQDDIQTVARLFKEEIEKDWTSVVGTVSTYANEYRFTEDWEVYYLNEGMIGYQYYRRADNNNKDYLKDENGKYYTTIDEKQPNATTDTIDNTKYRTDMENALGTLTGTAREAKMKETAINTVFQKYFFLPDEDGICEDKAGMLSEILTSWTCGVSGVKDEFIREAMGKDNSLGEDGELKVKSISGITTDKTNVKLENGKMGVDLEGEEHDVLIIKIDGVDPAAIYNFAFTVAPMHYYSTPELIEKAEYWEDTTKSNRFGVKFRDSDFMDRHLMSKNDTPVGAGPYKKRADSSKFNDNGTVRYERNEYFETLGSGIENAKIKYLNYVYTSDDQMINRLIKGEIDYGEPQCTPINIQTLSKAKNLNMQDYTANGFGYVGINPFYVPDRAIRVAIMLAMNPQSYIINTYYTTKYSSAIYRPTSTTNFLRQYDKTEALKTPYEFQNGDDYDGAIKGKKLVYTDNDDGIIQELVKSAGYTLRNGKLTNKDGKTLSYTFTIAGSSTDHPAFLMFTQAAKQLNKLGFDIKVKTEMNALQSLATGKLAVWAAAWSTGIDPDMYQIYHKDSNASSTKNWGYETIKDNANSAFDVEKSVLDHLSEEIDEARKVTAEEYRTRHYVKALNDVMELAVELPTYQRHDLGVYNGQILKSTSLNQNPSANAGLLYKIWELDYN